MRKAANISNVYMLLQQYGLHPRKKWGQNFLIDSNIIDKIIAAQPEPPPEYTVEIGPGLGALTQQLAVYYTRVLAIDIDESLADALRENLYGFPHVRFVFADFLSLDLEKTLTQIFELNQVPFYTVCANIPYNITTPIIFKLLEECTRMKQATLMVQKEVGLRLGASPGGKDYGLLTVMAAYYAQVNIISKISQNCFYPRPKVDSVIIRIIPHENPIKADDESLFKMLLRCSFQKRRKTMLNICQSLFSLEKTQISDILLQVNIAPQQRPETLSLQDFITLSNVFTQI